MKTLSIEEAYQKEVRGLNEELYKAYARITELIKERGTVVTEVQKLCKKISSHSNLEPDESLVKLPPLRESHQ